MVVDDWWKGIDRRGEEGWERNEVSEGEGRGGEKGKEKGNEPPKSLYRIGSGVRRVAAMASGTKEGKEKNAVSASRLKTSKHPTRLPSPRRPDERDSLLGMINSSPNPTAFPIFLAFPLPLISQPNLFKCSINTLGILSNSHLLLASASPRPPGRVTPWITSGEVR